MSVSNNSGQDTTQIKEERVSGKRNNKNTRRLEHWQVIAAMLMVYDFATASLSYFIALWLRFDLKYSLIDSRFLNAWRNFVPIYAIFVIVSFYLLGLYRSIWRFASFEELIRVVKASVVTMVFHTVFITILYTRMPVSYYIIGAGLQFVFVLTIRFSYRFFFTLSANSNSQQEPIM